MILKIAMVFYLLSTIACLLYFVTPKNSLGRVYMVSAIIGFLLHTVALALDYVHSGHIPITNFQEGMSFFSWTIILVFLILEYQYKILILGSFIIPMAFIFLLYPALLPHEISDISPLLKSYWLAIHVSLAFLGDAAFTLAFAISIMYIMQDNQLKGRHFGPTFRKLPSLEVLDALNHRVITVGFLLLTLGIITGALWARVALGSYLQGDPREIWSIITWLIYAALLHGRLTVGWRGRRSAIMAIIGFSVLVFAFVGVNLFLSSYHNPERF